MFGLELSKEFYISEVLPLLREELPDFLDAVCIGLVGEGSECFGFDDALSQDHDFGASLCFWLPDEELVIWRERVNRVLRGLPDEYKNFPVRITPERSQGRCGLMGIESFYARYTGRKQPPQTWQEWRTVPEHFLSVVTNGEIFHDERRIFTQFRNDLLAYYPEDVRLKKMTARLATMSQAGQYNLLRAVKRSQHTTTLISISRFCEASLSFVFLLNKRYMPFYKWASSGVRSLPLFGENLFTYLEQLTSIDLSQPQEAISIIEECCVDIADVLRTHGYSDIEDSWLLAHAQQIQSKISTPQLRMLSEMAE